MQIFKSGNTQDPKEDIYHPLPYYVYLKIRQIIQSVGIQCIN